MTYYQDYITDAADPIIDQVQADFNLFGADRDEVDHDLDEEFTDQLFAGVVRELVAYLYERRREGGGDGDLGPLFDPDNIASVMISARTLEAPTIIVEYHDTPEWFSMENAELREFYWYPNPAQAGEWSAGYFQPREATALSGGGNDE